MRARLFLGLVSASLVVPCIGQASPLFRITDVGHADMPAAINEKSTVLVDGTNNGAHDYIWTDGATKDVSAVPDQVFDMNDKGRVVGYTFDPISVTTAPVYWPKAGKEPHTLEQSLPEGSTYDRATGINTAGQIVGWLYYSNLISGPAYWDTNGVLTDLRPFVEPHCYLTPNHPKINDKGVIALSSCDHGYRVDAASLNAVQLEGFDTADAFSCNTCSQAYGINDKNYIVGTSRALFTREDHSTGVRNEATLWTNKSKAKDLGVLHIDGYPDVNSTAVAINSTDWVVGWTDNFGALQRAFLWTPDDKLKDLNKLIDPADPKHKKVTLLTANAINNEDEIVGVLSDSTLGGELRIYKLTRSN
jgi:hypothetical protein